MSRTRRERPAPNTRPSPQRRNTAPFFVTAHAVVRFQERIAPELSRDIAFRELIALAKTARRTADRTPGGDEVWIARGQWCVRFIVKPDPINGRTSATVVADSDMPDYAEDDGRDAE